MLRRKHYQDLADIVGEDHFSAEEYMASLYSHDVAALPGIVNDVLNPNAKAVAQPTTAEAVSNLLIYCREKNIPVIPRGHGTSGYGGALPTRGGLVVETTRMNEIHNIDRENMTVEVGSGIIWGRLLDLLEDEGLTVAAYPSSAPSSTVGGWVAAGGSGIGSTKYGGIREQVVDMEVVLADGKIIRTTDAPNDLHIREGDDYKYDGATDYYWKENEIQPFGKDVTELFIDSNGTLGIITKVVLKMIPLRNIRPMTASFRSSDLLFGALQETLEATRPFYLHFITEPFTQMLKKVGQAPTTSGEWIMLCAFEGTDDEVEGEVEKLKHVVGRFNGHLESKEIAEHEWAERFYPMRVKRLGPSLAPSEVYVPIENMKEFMTHISRHFKGEDFAVEGAVTDRGEVAVLTWFLDDERKRISFLMGWYRSLDFINIGIKHGGRAYSIGMWNAAHSRSYYGKEKYSKMTRIKKTTDPKGYLNSHKVFSGPLNLSTRMNLLIMFAVGVIVPIAIWFVRWLVPGILDAYVPWLAVNDLSSFLLYFAIGLVVGLAVSEIANLVPISVVLSIGAPFLRLGRKIFH
ncbi:MAG: FAD-binding oxidoreductase [Candidatus Thorarchaeota archaeon]